MTSQKSAPIGFCHGDKIECGSFYTDCKIECSSTKLTSVMIIRVRTLNYFLDKIQPLAYSKKKKKN